MSKRLLLTGRANRYGITLNFVPPTRHQETLHLCPLCRQHYSRTDMWIVGNWLVCVDCAGAERDASEEE